MNPVTPLTSRLGIRYPIVQAPMAGVSTPALAAAVSNAGGLGSLGIGNVAVQQAADIIRQTRVLTSRPFNVNVFCHQPARRNLQREADWLAYLSRTFAIPADQLPATLNEIYLTALGNTELLNMLLAERPAVVSFHFGVPGAEWISALRGAGVIMLGCATSLPEAQQLQQSGVDIIVAQGMEAGGHRGVFDPGHDPLLGTFALTRLLTSQLAVPVIAAGGIMDGNGIAAAIQLGAAGVQMGTAFIACPESSASAAYRQQLLGPDAQHTAITAAISGRPARGMVNKMYLPDVASLPLPDYPVAYDAVKALHQLAATQGCHDYAAHWAGQGAPLARAMPAAALLQQLVEEWQACS